MYMPFDILRHVNPRAAGRIAFGGGGGGSPAPTTTPAAPTVFKSSYPELAGKEYSSEAAKNSDEGAVRADRQKISDYRTAVNAAKGSTSSDSRLVAQPSPVTLDSGAVGALGAALPSAIFGGLRLAEGGSVEPNVVTANQGSAQINSGTQQVMDLQQRIQAVNAVPKPAVTYGQDQIDKIYNDAIGALNTSLQSAQQQMGTLMKGAQQQLAYQAMADPTSLVKTANVGEIDTTGTEIAKGTGQLNRVTPTVKADTVDTTVMATAAPKTPASTIEAAKVSDQAAAAANAVQAAQGTVSPQSLVDAAQGTLSSGATATAETFDKKYLDLVQSGELPVTSDQLVTAQGLDAIAPSTKIAQTTGIDPAVAVLGTVSQNELPEAAQIKESDMVQAQAVVSDGKLSVDATAVAARLDSFNVDNGTLAAAAQGNVNAQDTVQGQLANLMKQFDDGTPVWAAGAMRAANAAMAARGLGGSSMAGAAILQAAMESAIPIAAQDAQVFQQMNLTNLNNRQQVALANAAAQQGLALANLNNEQQAALQNSANAFALQSQDLSAMQQTVIANAQIKAALQGQNLSNQQQANLAVAARYAEVANINLNNKQQTALQNNANALQVDLANLSNKQQAYLANAQLEAALQNKVLDNQQQAAVLNAARFSEAANIQFTAEQQAQLHNSELMKTIGLAELNASQAATLQNASTVAAMDMANLNNRQQAAVQNAKAFLDMDMTNLNNQQQVTLFKAQAIQQALFSDQAAENAARQFNASSENQTNQFFANLATQTSQFNASQVNATKQFNAGQTNAMAQFNSNMKNQREQFNAQNALVVAQANAQWRQSVATTEYAAQHEANMEAAKTANGITTAALDQIWQRERDLMSFAWKSSESNMDRNLSILLADKNLEATRMELDAAEEEARGSMFAKAMDWIW